MVGPLMYGIAADPVAGAKVLSEFARENERFVIRGGAMRNSVMSDKDVKALALLPSREELLAKLMGTLAGADGQAGAHAERGAGQVRPNPRRPARCQIRNLISGEKQWNARKYWKKSRDDVLEGCPHSPRGAHQGHGQEVRRVRCGGSVVAAPAAGGGAPPRGGGEDRVSR